MPPVPGSGPCSPSPAACWSKSVCPNCCSPGRCCCCCRQCFWVWRRCWPPPGFRNCRQQLAALTEIGTALALLAIVAVGWIGWRPLFRIAEINFWSLNALAVQPGYAFTREALRHLTERIWGRKLTVAGRARLRSANSVGGRHRAVRMRRAGRDAGLARLALDGRLERPGLAASPRHADAGKCHRAGVGISGGRIADVGICGCQHAATRRPRRVRYRVRPRGGAGALRICRTCT